MSSGFAQIAPLTFPTLVSVLNCILVVHGLTTLPWTKVVWYLNEMTKHGNTTWGQHVSNSRRYIRWGATTRAKCKPSILHVFWQNDVWFIGALVRLDGKRPVKIKIAAHGCLLVRVPSKRWMKWRSCSLVHGRFIISRAPPDRYPEKMPIIAVLLIAGPVPAI
jgi:hypothetical protein